MDPSLSARDLVCTLASEPVDWKVRASCERRLLALPARDVLPAVEAEPLSHFGFDPAIHNSHGSAEGDRDAPWRWQAHHALARLRRHFMEKTPPDEPRRILAARDGADDDPEMGRIAVYLDRMDEDPGLEQVALGVMRDRIRPMQHRLDAAKALLWLEPTKHTTAVADFALSLPSLEEIMPALVEATFESGAKPDPRIVRRVFETLEKSASDATSWDAGYYTAIDAGKLVGETFEPDETPYRKKPGTRGPDLSPAFYQDTTARALSWWRANQGRFAR